VLGGIKDPGGSSELDAALRAEVQPGDIVLQGIVTGETGKLNAQDDVDFSGADVLLEAGAFAQVFDFSPGGRGVAVIVDFDFPTLLPGMGGQMLTLNG
jgi:hypothetical protein